MRDIFFLGTAISLSCNHGGADPGNGQWARCIGRRLIAAFRAHGQIPPREVSVADELSGLGSTRDVRCSVGLDSRGLRDEPDRMATGPENAEVSRCVEPLGAAGAFGAGGGRAAGVLGAAVPPLPGALRGGGAGGAVGPPAR